ncbi:MAG: hypothetical protein R6X02_24985 [Enhygromyxa sp.]
MDRTSALYEALAGRISDKELADLDPDDLLYIRKEICKINDAELHEAVIKKQINPKLYKDIPELAFYDGGCPKGKGSPEARDIINDVSIFSTQIILDFASVQKLRGTEELRTLQTARDRHQKAVATLGEHQAIIDELLSLPGGEVFDKLDKLHGQASRLNDEISRATAEHHQTAENMHRARDEWMAKKNDLRKQQDRLEDATNDRDRWLENPSGFSNYTRIASNIGAINKRIDELTEEVQAAEDKYNADSSAEKEKKAAIGQLQAQLTQNQNDLGEATRLAKIVDKDAYKLYEKGELAKDDPARKKRKNIPLGIYVDAKAVYEDAQAEIDAFDARVDLSSPQTIDLVSHAMARGALVKKRNHALKRMESAERKFQEIAPDEYKQYVTSSSAIDKSYEEIQSTWAALNTAAERFDSKVTRVLQAEIDDAKAKIAALTEELEAVGKSLEDKEDTLGDLEKEKQELESKVANLGKIIEGSQAAKSAETRKLRQELRQAERQLEKKKKQLEKEKKAKDELEKKQRGLESALNAWKTALKNTAALKYKHSIRPLTVRDGIADTSEDGTVPGECSNTEIDDWVPDTKAGLLEVLKEPCVTLYRHPVVKEGGKRGAKYHVVYRGRRYAFALNDDYFGVVYGGRRKSAYAIDRIRHLLFDSGYFTDKTVAKIAPIIMASATILRTEGSIDSINTYDKQLITLAGRGEYSKRVTAMISAARKFSQHIPKLDVGPQLREMQGRVNEVAQHVSMAVAGGRFNLPAMDAILNLMEDSKVLDALILGLMNDGLMTYLGVPLAKNAANPTIFLEDEFLQKYEDKLAGNLDAMTRKGSALLLSPAVVAVAIHNRIGAPADCPNAMGDAMTVALEHRADKHEVFKNDYFRQLSKQVAHLMKLRDERRVNRLHERVSPSHFGLWGQKVDDFNNHFKGDEEYQKHEGRKSPPLFDYKAAREVIPAWSENPRKPALDDERPPLDHAAMQVSVFKRNELDKGHADLGKWVDLGKRLVPMGSSSKTEKTPREGDVAEIRKSGAVELLDILPDDQGKPTEVVGTHKYLITTGKRSIARVRLLQTSFIDDRSDDPRAGRIEIEVVGGTHEGERGWIPSDAVFKR